MAQNLDGYVYPLLIHSNLTHSFPRLSREALLLLLGLDGNATNEDVGRRFRHLSRDVLIAKNNNGNLLNIPEDVREEFQRLTRIKELIVDPNARRAHVPNDDDEDEYNEDNQQPQGERRRIGVGFSLANIIRASVEESILQWRKAGPGQTVDTLAELMKIINEDELFAGHRQVILAQRRPFICKSCKQAFATAAECRNHELLDHIPVPAFLESKKNTAAVVAEILKHPAAKPTKFLSDAQPFFPALRQLPQMVASAVTPTASSPTIIPVPAAIASAFPITNAASPYGKPPAPFAAEEVSQPFEAVLAAAVRGIDKNLAKFVPDNTVSASSARRVKPEQEPAAKGSHIKLLAAATLNLSDVASEEARNLLVADVTVRADARPLVPDGERSSCKKCGTTVSSSIWFWYSARHHCRSCRDIFCSKCAKDARSVPFDGWEQQVRVCIDCLSKARSEELVEWLDRVTAAVKCDPSPVQVAVGLVNTLKYAFSSGTTIDGYVKNWITATEHPALQLLALLSWKHTSLPIKDVFDKADRRLLAISALAAPHLPSELSPLWIEAAAKAQQDDDLAWKCYQAAAPLTAEKWVSLAVEHANAGRVQLSYWCLATEPVQNNVLAVIDQTLPCPTATFLLLLAKANRVGLERTLDLCCEGLSASAKRKNALVSFIVHSQSEEALLSKMTIGCNLPIDVQLALLEALGNKSTHRLTVGTNAVLKNQLQVAASLIRSTGSIALKDKGSFICTALALLTHRTFRGWRVEAAELADVPLVGFAMLDNEDLFAFARTRANATERFFAITQGLQATSSQTVLFECADALLSLGGQVDTAIQLLASVFASATTTMGKAQSLLKLAKIAPQASKLYLLQEASRLLNNEPLPGDDEGQLLAGRRALFDGHQALVNARLGEFVALFQHDTARTALFVAQVVVEPMSVSALALQAFLASYGSNPAYEGLPPHQAIFALIRGALGLLASDWNTASEHLWRAVEWFPVDEVINVVGTLQALPWVRDNMARSRACNLVNNLGQARDYARARELFPAAEFPAERETEQRLRPSPDLTLLRSIDRQKLRHRLNTLEAAYAYLDASMDTSLFAKSASIAAAIVSFADAAIEAQDPAERFAYKEAMSDVCAIVFLLASHFPPSAQSWMANVIIRSFMRVYEHVAFGTRREVMVITRCLLTLFGSAPIALPAPFIPFKFSADQIFSLYVSWEVDVVTILEARKHDSEILPYAKSAYAVFEGVLLGWLSPDQAGLTLEEARRVCMGEMLDLPPAAVATNLASSHATTFTEDGWYDSDQRRLRFPPGEETYCDLLAVTIDNKTGEVSFEFAHSDKNNAALFSSGDVHEIMSRGIEDNFFSLDEVDPNLPYHPYQVMRYAPAGPLRGTRYLKALFEADYLLKFFTTGNEVSSIEPFDARPTTDGLLRGLPANIAELLQPLPRTGTPAAHRFWIENGEILYAEDEPNDHTNRYKFVAAVPMKIKQHLLTRDAHGNLVDDDTVNEEERTPELSFAKRTTENYDAIAKHYPEFARLSVLAKLAGARRFIRSHHNGLVASKEPNIGRVVAQVSLMLDEARNEYPMANNQAKIDQVTDAAVEDRIGEASRHLFDQLQDIHRQVSGDHRYVDQVNTLLKKAIPGATWSDAQYVVNYGATADFRSRHLPSIRADLRATFRGQVVQQLQQADADALRTIAGQLNSVTDSNDFTTQAVHSALTGYRAGLLDTLRRALDRKLSVPIARLASLLGHNTTYGEDIFVTSAQLPEDWVPSSINSENGRLVVGGVRVAVNLVAAGSTGGSGGGGGGGGGSPPPRSSTVPAGRVQQNTAPPARTTKVIDYARSNGPLPQLTERLRNGTTVNVQDTFRSGKCYQTTRGDSTSLYRVISAPMAGQPSGAVGGYWTTSRPRGALQHAIDAAIHPSWGNTATYVVKSTLPANTTTYDGRVAQQQGFVSGNGFQTYVPQESRGSLTNFEVYTMNNGQLSRVTDKAIINQVLGNLK